MLRKISLIAVAALAVASAPAVAQSFSGPRVGAEIGVIGNKVGGFSNPGSFTYGGDVGYDFDLGSAVLGGTVSYQASSNNALQRELAAIARVGAKVDGHVLVYALGGYSNLSIKSGTPLGNVHVDGYRLGGGAEFAVTKNVYLNLEERYSHYTKFGVGAHGWQTALGLGFRF